MSLTIRLGEPGYEVVERGYSRSLHDANLSAACNGIELLLVLREVLGATIDASEACGGLVKFDFAGGKLGNIGGH